MGLLSILFALAGSHLVRVFGSTPEVLTLSGLALRISAIELPFLAFTFVFIGALRGAGDTKTPLFVGLFCTLLIRQSQSQYERKQPDGWQADHYNR